MELVRTHFQIDETSVFHKHEPGWNVLNCCYAINAI